MTAILYAVTSVSAVLWLAAMARIVLVAARMLQIEEYERDRFARFAAHRAWMVHRSALGALAGALVAVVVALVVSAVREQWRDVVVAAGWGASSLSGLLLWTWPKAKKPLVATARMRRLLAATGVWLVLGAAAAALLIVLRIWPADVAFVVVIALTTPLAAGALLVANDGMRPVEAAVRRHYLRLARSRIAAVDPLVVAVAGSYGKTSTKHNLAQLLMPSVSTLPTRLSFNTLMGVSRVINEDLRPSHRVFVVEMDAYAPGEIAAISGLVHPRLAVVTSVGPQHLERFGSTERIAGALYEVIAALPQDGTAVIHSGDDGGVQLAVRAADEGHHVVRYALQGAGDADVIADNVMLDGTGARFRWMWAAHRLQADVAISLLGEHQVLNVTAALAVVHLLGYDVDAAVKAAATLQPVPHRLQLLQSGGPVTVIDDSYNANPVGVHNALDVLAAMQGGARILVTPGLVELGALEAEENRRYGEHAARVCDDVVVVAAAPAAALVRGLHDGGLDDAHIHVVRSLTDATAIIGSVARRGDIVLFANDLPDTYMPASGAAVSGSATC